MLNAEQVFRGRWGVGMSDKQIVDLIREIVSRGNNAEVKAKPDGTLVVLEVKKKIVARQIGA